MSRCTHLIPDVCSCHVLRVFAVDVCRIWDVCCLPAPAHQPFSSNNSDFSTPEEAFSSNVRASGTLKCGYEGVFNVINVVHLSQNNHIQAIFFLFILSISWYIYATVQRIRFLQYKMERTFQKYIQLRYNFDK